MRKVFTPDRDRYSRVGEYQHNQWDDELKAHEHQRVVILVFSLLPDLLTNMSEKESREKFLKNRWNEKLLTLGWRNLLSLLFECMNERSRVWEGCGVPVSYHSSVRIEYEKNDRH